MKANQLIQLHESRGAGWTSFFFWILIELKYRRCKKQDLKRIAKATGAQFVSSLANVEGEESFEASFLGDAAEVGRRNSFHQLG